MALPGLHPVDVATPDGRDAAKTAQMQREIDAAARRLAKEGNPFRAIPVGNWKFKWGGPTDTGGWGVTSINNFSFAHGESTTPVWAIMWADTGVTTGDGDDPIICSLRSLDSTNINVRLATRSGGNANFPSVNVYWLAIWAV